MKKLAIFSVFLMVFGLSTVVQAGPFDQITLKKRSATIGTYANEYHFEGVQGVLECDNDMGDVGNGVYLYYLIAPGNSPEIHAKKCVIKWNGDYFDKQTINWCADRNKCPNGYNVTTQLGEKKLCTRMATRTFGNTVLSQPGDLACVIENKVEAPVQPAPTPVTPVKPVTPVTPVKPVTPVAPVKPEPTTFDCSASTIVWAREVREKYYNDDAIAAAVKQIIDYCTNTDATKRSQTQLEYYVSELKILIKRHEDANAQADAAAAASEANRLAALENARKQAQMSIVNTSTTVIKSSVVDIDRTLSGLKVTVWRDAEGKFNTSRLISDSVAGVVLGTAGGLITSNVIKKNQVSNGFEDINCSVGGQVVAGWGDEFSVGIR